MEGSPLPETVSSDAPSSPDGGGPPAPSSGAPATPPRKFRIKKKVLLLGLLILLIGGLATTFAALGAGALKLSFIPEEIALSLVKTYAKLPLVPKKPIHILLLSLDSSLEIKTFSLDTSLSMEGLDLAISGDVEVKGEEANASLHLRGKSTSPGTSFDLEADLVSLERILYFKIDTLESPLLSILTTLDLDPILGNWWRYDLSPLETQARKELEESQGEEAKTLTQKAQKKALEIFSEPEILKAVVLEEAEKIGEEESYHLKVSVTKEFFGKIWEVLREEPLTAQEKEGLEKSFEAVEDLELDLWIGKNSRVARKIRITFSLSPSLGASDGSITPYLGLLQTFAGALVIEIPKINTPVSITAPLDSSDVQDLVELLFGDLPPLDVLGEQTKLYLRRK